MSEPRLRSSCWFSEMKTYSPPWTPLSAPTCFQAAVPLPAFHATTCFCWAGLGGRELTGLRDVWDLGQWAEGELGETSEPPAFCHQAIGFFLRTLVPGEPASVISFGTGGERKVDEPPADCPRHLPAAVWLPLPCRNAGGSCSLPGGLVREITREGAAPSGRD